MAQVTITKVAGAATAGATSAFTSVTGRTYLAVMRNGQAVKPTAVTSTNGIVFSEVAASLAGSNMITVWAGVCSGGGSSGTATSTYTGSTNPSINILEMPAGTYIKATATGNATSSSISASLASITSESACLMVAVTGTGSALTVTPESGYTNLSPNATAVGDTIIIKRESDVDFTPSCTVSASVQWNAIALECAWYWNSSLSYVGQASGTTTATLPAHQAGDLIVIYAFRDGNATAPSLPAGWVSINTSTTTSTGSRLGYKWARNASETSGTWTNATTVIAQVYRGHKYETPIGGNSQTVGTTNTSVAWGNITLTDTNGTSWVAAMRGHRSVDTTLETAPSGLTARSTVVDATDEAAGFDTNGAVASGSTWTAPAGQNIGGTASGWTAQAVAIRRGIAEPAVTLSGQSGTAVTTTGFTPRVTSNKNSGTIYMVVVPDGNTPSVAQIKAGQRSDGTAAINAQSITSAYSNASQDFTAVTGLTIATPYDVWFVHTYNAVDSTAVKADVTTSGGAVAAVDSLFFGQLA